MSKMEVEAKQVVPYQETPLDAKTKDLLCELCRQFYTLGWVTGTGGSISIKTSENKIFMSPSSVQKERMVASDIFVMDDKGVVIKEGVNPDGIKVKLSQCHPLFMSAYLHRNSGAVIHTHSIWAVLVSLYSGDEFRATHMEMIKGIEHHGYESELVIPVIDNTPQEEDLRDSLTAALLKYPKANAVIVRRHGVYVWGRDWRHAKAQCECLDYVMQLAVEMRRMGLDPADKNGARPLAVEDKTYSGGCCVSHQPVMAAPAAAANGAGSKKRKAVGGSEAAPVTTIVMDIEGTTTPIDFVTVEMFGYARDHVAAHLSSTWASAETQTDVAALRALAEADVKSHAAGAVGIPGKGKAEDIQKAVVANVLWQMSADRKSTALKELQGHIWKAGFDSGALQGMFYQDVQPALESWTRRNYKLYIYSSGSVNAQKMLFEHPKGQASFLPHIKGHYDTNIGMKREAKSYSAIATDIHTAPENIMFLTDIYEEAVAADAAGFQVTLIIRPGNKALPAECTFATAHSFVDLAL